MDFEVPMQFIPAEKIFRIAVAGEAESSNTSNYYELKKFIDEIKQEITNHATKEIERMRRERERDR